MSARFGSAAGIRHDRILILGQGPSFREVDTEILRLAAVQGVALIAVNGAIDYVPWCDYWFTLDPGVENRARMERRLANTRYFAAVPDAFGTPAAKSSDHRKPPPSHVTLLRRVAGDDGGRGPFERRVRRQIVGGLAEDPSQIHTGNSAFGALGLAYHMRPRRVGLLGIDGRGRRRWDGSKNLSLDHMPDLFAGAVAQLKRRGVCVLNGSPDSAVTCFPRVEPNEAIQLVMEG